MITHNQRLQHLAHQIPLLKAANAVVPLAGGLTNTNYVIETAGRKYVMRVSHDSSALLGIDRQRERINTERAAMAGVGPGVAAAYPDEAVLIVDWLEATTVHANDFHRHPGLLDRVAAVLRQLHSGPTFHGDFHFPALRKKYLRVVMQNNYFLPGAYLETEPAIMELEQLLADNPEPLVPCNNDLLAENFMDDGQKLWIIDYEYAGQNEASFEIGNLYSETGLDESQLTGLCEAYWKKHRPEKIARAVAWSMIARYGWVLWASIQEANSPIPFDFRTWGLKKWTSVLADLNSEKYHNLKNTLKRT